MRKFFTITALSLALLFWGYHTYQQHSLTDIQAKETKKIKKTTQPLVMRNPINWKLPSETVAYPDINKLSNFWIKVSISKNRVYLMNDNKVVYTMYASAGEYEKQADGTKKSTTPTGTYYIQAERGDSFYNPNLSEGANYWTSWLNHGEYLFHTVPTDANGNYKLNEAKKLGKKPASHGCIRLSVADAKWINQNVKVGTKVVIED